MSDLLFGPLDLMADDSDFQLVALSTDEGTSWGNPDTVDVELRSFLQYGALVETENWTNRELIVAISISGATSDDVARNEKTLVAQLHRRNTLAYTPETATVATIFPVLTATLVPTHDDFLESFEHEVIYQIRMTCTPFVRGSELLFVDAIIPEGEPSETAIVTVDGASSGWTAFFSYMTDDEEDTGPADSYAYGSGGITLSATGYIPYSEFSQLEAFFSRSFTAYDVGAHNLFYVDWKTNNPGLFSGLIQAFAGGALAHAGDIVSPVYAGYTRSYFELNNDDDLTGVLLEFWFSRNVFFSPYPTVTIKEIGVSNSLPSLSGRQLVRSLEIDGVMPTTGSIAVVSPDETGLDEVHIYTCPRQGAELYLPPCRSYLLDTGGTVPDSTAVSGAKTDITAFFRQFYIPSTRLPDGEYLLGVRADMSAKNAAGRSINIRAAAQLGGFTSPTEDFGNIDTSYLYDDTLDGWQYLPLMTLGLPRVRMAVSEEAYTIIDIRAAAGTGTAYLDELFLWNLTIGELTHVIAGDLTRLWIDSPDISNDGQLGIWLGDQADRSDQVSGMPTVQALDIHQFDPIKGVNVTSVATGPEDPVAVSFAYYPQFWYRVPPPPADEDV